MGQLTLAVPGQKFTKPAGSNELALQSEIGSIISWGLQCLWHLGELHSKDTLKNFKLTRPQLTCIVALRDNGSMPLSRLGALALIGPSTVTGVVDRLELRKLVVRERSLEDRRIVMVHLTPKGRLISAQAPPLIPQAIIDGLAKLSVEEGSRIAESLFQLVAMTRDETYYPGWLQQSPNGVMVE